MRLIITPESPGTWLRIAAVLILFGSIISVFPASADIFSEDGSNFTAPLLYTLTNSTKPVDTNRSIEFFFDPTCGACTPAHEYLESYLSEHPGTKVEMVNLSSGQDAQDRLNERYLEYHRDLLNIPVIFIGPFGLEGTEEIRTNFEGLYHWYNKPE